MNGHQTQMLIDSLNITQELAETFGAPESLIAQIKEMKMELCLNGTIP